MTRYGIEMFVGNTATDDIHMLLNLCHQIIDNGVDDATAYDKASKTDWSFEDVRAYLEDKYKPDQFAPKVGEEMWWTDPDGGISSGYYTITAINGETAVINNGKSEAEVPLTELTPF